jgi:ornithine cyclodeaminase/alanine dehydrogenase-like protein (mu-crystallin family)
VIRCSFLVAGRVENNESRVTRNESLTQYGAVSHRKRRPEIGEVIAGRAPGRSSDRQITLYESHGMGLQDVYVGAKILELARSRGIGTDLPIVL